MQHRHIAVPLLLSMLVGAIYILAHWYRVPLPEQPRIDQACTQPDVSRQLVRQGVAASFQVSGTEVSEQQARDGIDAQLRAEANTLATQYEFTCAEETCAAQKTGIYETRPQQYDLAPLPDGGYRMANGTLADFFVEIECIRRMRRSG